MNLQFKFETVFSKNANFSTFLNKNDYLQKYSYPTFNSNSLNILKKYKNYQKMNILMISNSTDRKECQTFYQNTIDLLKEFKLELKDIFCLLHISNDSKLLEEVNQNFEKYYDILNKKEQQMENKLLTSSEIWALIDNEYFLNIYNTLFTSLIEDETKVEIETKIEDKVEIKDETKVEDKNIKSFFKDNFEDEYNFEDDFEDEEYSAPVEQYVDTLLPDNTYYSTSNNKTKMKNQKVNNDSEYERRYAILESKSLQELKQLVESIGEYVHTKTKDEYIKKCINIDWLF